MWVSNPRAAGVVLMMALIVTGLSISSVNAASVAEKLILQGIQITEKATAVELQIDFTQPLQYVRHFPLNAGEILQIQLQATVDLSIKDSASARRESMLPPVNDIVPLLNVIYEGSVPGGPFLTLRFRHVVEYVLSEGPGGKSVIVSVKKNTAGMTAGAEGESTLPSDQKLDGMMEEVRQALARDDPGRAIQLLGKLLQLPDHKYSQDARELIGVAREKKGQIARAKLEYQEYLRLYTAGEGAERVRNRLAAIELAQVEPREKLKEVKAKTTAEIDTYGRFSQRYYQDITKTDANGTTQRSLLTSFLNFSGRYRGEEYDVRGFFNGHHMHPMQGGGEDEYEPNTAYFDIKNRPQKFSAVLGRQSSNKGGIFGRFDGVLASYEFLPKYELTATFGKPVAFSSSSDIGKRIFYSAALSAASFVENWNGNGYYIQQEIEGVLDRRAVGGDVRYADKVYSAFASVDYDVSYQLLNLVFLRAGWKVADQTRVDVNYNLRQSPLLFTSNALQSEFSEFKALQAVAGESAMRDKARRVSSLSRLLTVSVVYDVDQNNQINADWTRSSIDGKPEIVSLKAADPIPAQPKYGPENTYSVQYITSNYFVERDLHFFGGSFSKGEDRSYAALFLRSRFPYGEHWYIGPRIQLDRTQNAINNSQVIHPSAALKLDYRWKKQVSFEVEIGYDIDRYSGDSNADASRTTLYFGYDVDF